MRPSACKTVCSCAAFSPGTRWEVYADIDVALMATTFCEPLGRVPLEAAAASAPTIAPAVGGIVESIRHNVNGLLYRFRDAAGLERQMRTALTESGLVRKLIDHLPARWTPVTGRVKWTLLSLPVGQIASPCSKSIAAACG